MRLSRRNRWPALGPSAHSTVTWSRLSVIISRLGDATCRVVDAVWIRSTSSQVEESRVSTTSSCIEIRCCIPAGRSWPSCLKHRGGCPTRADLKYIRVSSLTRLVWRVCTEPHTPFWVIQRPPSSHLALVLRTQMSGTGGWHVRGSHVHSDFVPTSTPPPPSEAPLGRAVWSGQAVAW